MAATMMHETREKVRHGDDVVLSLGSGNLVKITILSDEKYQTKFGCLEHNSVIGKDFGSKIRLPFGWLTILPLSPELWTLTLRHRTQILFFHDISLIIFYLDLQPGCVVVESGTGSGSLSHSILRTIAPDGMLHTHEFNESRCNEATAEFIKNGYEKCARCYHRDVLHDGFDVEESSADAVFLDLPSPWLAISHAAAVLKYGGRICTFSPCIEQVQRTVAELRSGQFNDLFTIECIYQRFTVRQFDTTSDNGYDPRQQQKETLVVIDDEVGGILDTAEAEPPPDKVPKIENSSAASSYQRTRTCIWPISPSPSHTGFLTFATYRPIPST